MTYEQEKINPYKKGGNKSRQVEQMFDNIAPSYDLLNHLLSLGIDRRWRRAAIDSLKPYQPEELLDVATDTGDFLLLAAERLETYRFVGVDLSKEMLRIARRKTFLQNLWTAQFWQADCMNLPFNDESFDAVTVAYGVRNFADLDQGLQEMRRVTRANGRLVILELCTPNSFPMKQLFWLYAHGVIPLLGRLFSKDKCAYSYLPATMRAFPQGEVFVDILAKNGWKGVSFRRFTFGLCTLYTAHK